MRCYMIAAAALTMCHKTSVLQGWLLSCCSRMHQYIAASLGSESNPGHVGGCSHSTPATSTPIECQPWHPVSTQVLNGGVEPYNLNRSTVTQRFCREDVTYPKNGSTMVAHHTACLCPYLSQQKLEKHKDRIGIPQNTGVQRWNRTGLFACLIGKQPKKRNV